MVNASNPSTRKVGDKESDIHSHPYLIGNQTGICETHQEEKDKENEKKRAKQQKMKMMMKGKNWN